MKKKPYAELNGRIVANNENCSSIAQQIGISVQAMSARMTGKIPFTAIEMSAIGNILNLSKEEYYQLFILPADRKGGHVL